MSINRNEESILRLPGITPVAGADSKDDDTGAGGGSPGPEVSRQNRTDWAMPLPPSCTGLLLMRPARPGFEVGTAMVSKTSLVLAFFYTALAHSFRCSLSGSPGKRLQGRICLVTGGARGIGKGIALGLGDEGATVYVTGRTEKDVVSTAEEVTSRGGRGIPVIVDHSKVDEIKALFDKIRAEQSELHLLVNNCYSAAGVLMQNRVHSTSL